MPEIRPRKRLLRAAGLGPARLRSAGLRSAGLVGPARLGALSLAAGLGALSLAACGDSAPSMPTTTTEASTGGDDTTTAEPGTTTGGDDTTLDGSTGPASTDTDDCTPEPAQQMPIAIENEYGVLHGTLMLPEGCAPFDVVLFHVGSGPTDRDGNSALLMGDNDSLLLLAEALQQEGIASIRYDKRAVGESIDAVQPDLADLRFEDYVADIELWIESIRSTSTFGALTLLGHSEGALIAAIASQARTSDRLISLAGAGRPGADVLREQLAASLNGALLDEALAILDQLELGNTVDDIPVELQGLFGPTVQPYLISWFAHDPAQELSATGVPTLIAAGTTDIQIPVSDAELLADARPDAELCIVEGMNHVLKEATLDPASQDQAYTDPSLPVVPQLVDCVVGFVRADR